LPRWPRPPGRQPASAPVRRRLASLPSLRQRAVRAGHLAVLSGPSWPEARPSAAHGRATLPPPAAGGRAVSDATPTGSTRPGWPARRGIGRREQPRAVVAPCCGRRPRLPSCRSTARPPLDAIIGHHSPHYDVRRAAALLAEAATLVPARITGLLAAGLPAVGGSPVTRCGMLAATAQTSPSYAGGA